MNDPVFVAFSAVALGLFIVIACILFKRTAIYSIPMIPLLVGSAFLEEELGIADGSTLLKACSVSLIFLALIASGIRRNVSAPLIYIGSLSIAGLIPVMSGGASIDTAMMLSYFGYIFAWGILAIDFQKLNIEDLAKAMALIPMCGLGLNLLLAALGVTQVFRTESSTGLFRLAGTLASSHFGSLFVIGVIGGAAMFYMGLRYGLLLSFANLLLCALTLTRGPLLVAVLIFAGAILSTPIGRTRSKVAVYAGGISAAVALAITFAEEVLSRFEGSGLTGRDVAWRYYYEHFLASPIVGHGLGSAAKLSEYARNITIREYFIAPHNTYLQLLVEVGIAGTVLVCIALVILTVSAIRNSPKGFRPVVVLGCAGFLMFAYFDNLLNSFHPLFGFILLIGMAAYMPKSSTPSWPPQEDSVRLRPVRQDRYGVQSCEVLHSVRDRTSPTRYLPYT
ncbi:O-antigen ligase family protein [Cellulosimicrobium funkei]|nr:O-antigen ligase family protein [Cellulosimicrobium funkei]